MQTQFSEARPHYDGLPHVRIGDDVRGQHKLITEKFGLDNLALVVGADKGITTISAIR